MKNLKYIFILVLFGCSSSKVVYDYDGKTDFSQYKTFDFFEDVGDGMNEIDARRFTSHIENQLDSLGLQKKSTPNFYINVISEKSEIANDNVGIGIGSIGRNVGFGISTGIPIGGKKINEKVTIDFVDAKDNQLFWQGILNIKVREKIKPEDRVLLVQDIVKKILEKYPPKK